MAEQEQQHRMLMERAALESDHRHRDEVLQGQRDNARSVFRSDMVGQILGGLIGIGCVAGAIVSVIVGAHPAVTIALVGLPVVAIIKAVRNFTAPKRPVKT